VLLSIETDVNVFAHLPHGAAEQRQIGNLLEHPKQSSDIAIPLRLALCFEAVAGNLCEPPQPQQPSLFDFRQDIDKKLIAY